MFDIWVDADSVPRTHRPIILKAAARLGFRTYFVADRPLGDVDGFASEQTHRLREELKATGVEDEAQIKACRSNISMVVVSTGADSADDYIVENVKCPALCITHDIPLASRLLEKGVDVIDDRGETYTNEDIKTRLGDRLVNQELRTMGVFAQQSRIGVSLTKAFADNLDRTITKMLKRNQ